MTNSLAGFASLPADTFAEGPPAGGDDGSGNPIDANGRTGPFEGQPVQGFSGVQFAPDNTGAFWFLSDNGFGSQDNSADYLLRIYQVDPNFAGIEDGDASVAVENFIQLSDPDNLLDFEIINEDTEDRLLTGADFDIESFVIGEDGDIWIGEEFGPFVLHFNGDGELIEAPIATPNITSLDTLNGQDPLVIGHRGASGLLPEHTLEAYATAIAQGADFIEPDLVTTSDGVLIARHEPMLDDTTNVAEVFGEERMSTKLLDGEEVTAYFAEDFTLEEIKQLRAVQSRDFRSQEFNEAFEIPTFAEVIELVQETEAETGVSIGIYPETKHPTFFDEQGLSLEEPLVQTLIDTGFTDPERIFIQSFEVSNLVELSATLEAAGLGDIPLVQLFGDTAGDFINDGGGGFSVPFDFVANFGSEEFSQEDAVATYGEELLSALGIIGEDGSYNPEVGQSITYGEFANPEAIEIISSYAGGLGPWKNNILLREELEEPVDGDGDGNAEITTQLTGEVFPLVDFAHDAGLQVHPYTLRDEERFLTLDADGEPQTPEDEFKQLIDVGVDGFFTDFPATGVSVVDSVTGDLVLAPENPFLGDALPNLASSRGFEGMAFSPDRSTLYPLLEGTVDGDPENALRIYEFDAESSSFTGLVGFYPTTDGNPIGDFTPINDTEFLVIERDSNEGESAEFKKISKIDISEIDEDGFVEKTELVDLLNIEDPDDLNGDGETIYDMPFVTIEDVVVVDEDTILVANDNNFPFSMGRESDIDNNEIALIDLEQPLDLDPTLGGSPLTDTSTPDTELETTLAQVDSGTTSVFFDLPLLESAAGITLVGTDTTGEPVSDDFQVGFPIVEDTDFTFEIDPVVPVSGSFEHSGTVTLGLGDTDVTIGDFSIAFDETRISDTASGFFVADTTDDALGLEVLFDVGIPGEVTGDTESLTIADKDLLIAPELAEALGDTALTGADVGDVQIDAVAIEVEPDTAEDTSDNSVIFIHPDGTSPSHFAAGRFASVGPDGRLNWDNMTDAGVYLGHMDDQVVATSNGGAVVHAYGIKSQAGSYGFDEEGNPYTSLSGQSGMTIMEEAIAADKATAVINSGFIAEPGTGVFLADVENRSEVAEITAEIVESGVDVIMGGGEIHYLPVGTVGRFGEEGIREDGRNLIEEAEEMGYTVVYTREELESLSADSDKVLGIFAAEDTYNDVPEGALKESGFVDENGELVLYGQPGNENPPTVAEMLEATLGLDTFSDPENGMFVVLEEEGTDNFGNNNNAAGTIEAVLRADEALGVAQDYIDNTNSDTLLITAADSDGGGLEVDDVASDAETVGTTGVQPPFETEIPYDGTTGEDTEPFTTGEPDANGDTFDFGVLWTGVPDVAGSIVSKTYGLNAEELPATIDNTGIYRLMYETLFETELAPPEGVPDDFSIAEPPEATEDTGNVIFIHPDGTSPSHYAAARFASQGTDGRLNWDNMTDAGVYLGHIDDRIVATSNAGAVVHAFGVKPFAGSYGLDESSNPITSLSGQEGTTILEEAIAADKPTAVINSGFIAEPGTGVFLADVEDRGEVAEITAEIVESGVDVIMGGGEIHYLPVGTVGRFGEEGIREDGRNLIEEAEEMGYTVVYTREELESLSADSDKVLGIFAAEDTYNDTDEATLTDEGFVDENGELILYGQPGNENPPTVAEMLDVTLGLDKFTHAEDGFMVVLEEEGSDNFPNNNNGAGTIEATLRADAAIGVAQDFVNNVDPNTLVLTAADSDGGGLEVVDVDAEDETVGTIGVQPTLAAFGDDADGIPVPLDGTTGNDTEPFTTGAPDADGDIFDFGLAYPSTTDVAGSIVSKAFGLNSDMLDSTVDNTDMYRIMYETLFGVEPEIASGALDDGVAGLDTLTGAAGADTFILGDEEAGTFYSSSGFDDFAEISHFVSGEDSIQLAGSQEDYSFLVDGGNNVAIALDNDGDGAFDLAFDEFVALVGDGFETTDLVFV
ncbi:MAG: alkaline phosphatase [Cyanobacteria bacterium J06642_3]